MVDKWIGYLGEKNVRKNTLFTPKQRSPSGPRLVPRKALRKESRFWDQEGFAWRGAKRGTTSLLMGPDRTALYNKMNKERGRLSKEINQKLDGMVGFLLLQALSRLVAQLKLRGMDEGTKWKKLMSA
ncbi:hypothetical protein MGG_14821 [Pyricularia oryzae 70-15]|uniref:Uncharacterized protein n=3 Tax=Pyricularia oryzae TaxID=318829 RepID=G4NAJ5_PYRO7|nr:uncharacterized protein MGG_14821 [Pyricularia oryzae 70-15]EHA51333.1 hypothetical protein MGG_14821 [Pyricularia oryzae 70-15]ELQ33107.1 hypothetical protein OOU_Y34scaffold01003g26 [Pyricularia oryzae Y34]